LLVNAMRCQWAKSSGWRCRQQPVLPTPLRASCGVVSLLHGPSDEVVGALVFPQTIHG
jgi:hypothetical protein